MIYEVMLSICTLNLQSEMEIFQRPEHQGSIFTVQLCCMHPVYDKPITSLVLCKSNLQLAYNNFCCCCCALYGTKNVVGF